MKPAKILFVDDEPMALKYFERLISPLAPVLTASSVAEGKKILQLHRAEIAVLVSDQRMPGALGNELLRFAREHHPTVIRLLTTAYSELGEAIEAINSGEIYRYITKPWDMDRLRADLKNALELADLRYERDSLLREKMQVRQHQLLASRAGELAITCAGFVGVGYGKGLQTFLEAAIGAKCQPPALDWQLQDFADLTQTEAQRSIAIGQLLAQWQTEFQQSAPETSALVVLAQALPGQIDLRNNGQMAVVGRQALTALFEAPIQELPTREATAWLAWLLCWGKTAQVRSNATLCEVSLAEMPPDVPLQRDWLADCIVQLVQAGG